MSKRDWKPAGAGANTPYITVRDAAAARDFYAKAFGFEVKEEMPGPGGKPMHIGMSFHGQSVVMFAPEGGMDGKDPMRAPASAGTIPPVAFYVYCPDVDAQLARAREAGATIKSEAKDMFWGDRMGWAEDPDGYVWAFATNIGEFDPAKAPKFD